MSKTINTSAIENKIEDRYGAGLLMQRHKYSLYLLINSIHTISVKYYNSYYKRTN